MTLERGRSLWKDIFDNHPRILCAPAHEFLPEDGRDSEERLEGDLLALLDCLFDSDRPQLFASLDFCNKVVHALLHGG